MVDRQDRVAKYLGKGNKEEHLARLNQRNEKILDHWNKYLNVKDSLSKGGKIYSILFGLCAVSGTALGLVGANGMPEVVSCLKDGFIGLAAGEGLAFSLQQVANPRISIPRVIYNHNLEEIRALETAIMIDSHSEATSARVR